MSESTEKSPRFQSAPKPKKAAPFAAIGSGASAGNLQTERKQEDSLVELTRQLERQSNVFNTTLSSITDFAYIFDRDGRFLYANQPLLDLWGLKLDEAVGKNFFDLQYPDDLASRLQEQIQQVLETRQGLRDETRYINPAGVEGFYEYIFTPVFAADGTVEVVAGSTRDYTERRQTELLLDTQRQALEMVVGGSPLVEVLNYLAGIVEHQSAGSAIASILLLDEQGRLHNGASPSLPDNYVKAIDGIKADKNVGTCCAAAATSKTVISPDIGADPKWQDLKHLPLGLGLQAAWSLPIMAADERVLGTFGTYFREKREPTEFERQTVVILARTAALAIERMRAEEELNASEGRLRTIFEASRDGILVEDHERIVYVNQSYTHLLGYAAPEELIGKRVSSVISSADEERLLEFGKSRLRGKLSASVYEFKGKRKDGTLIELEASVSASAVSGHSYITSIVRDITARKRAEEELKEINEQLERGVVERTAALSEMNTVLQDEVRERRRVEVERVELLGRVIFAQEDERGRIALEMHDQFGQQLTALKIKLDALKEDYQGDRNLSEQLETLQTIAIQLDADVDHMVWEMRPTALNDLGLPAALSSYIRTWTNHFGVPVQLHTGGMDKDRLTQEIETALYRIAQEALNNIAKHAQASRVAIVLERRADQVSLIVEDDGVGFDLQQVLAADYKRLGLMGLRERAALVGGTVEIESQPDNGATVVVRIPSPSLPETGETDE